MQVLLVLNLIVPFVMIFVGYILKKNPVSDIASHSGYNTPMARRSQEHWDYAQSIAPGIFVSVGKVALVAEIVLNILLVLLAIHVLTAVRIGMIVGIIFLVYGFYKTEMKIKHKFEEEE